MCVFVVETNSKAKVCLFSSRVAKTTLWIHFLCVHANHSIVFVSFQKAPGTLETGLHWFLPPSKSTYLVACRPHGESYSNIRIIYAPCSQDYKYPYLW